MLTLSFKTYWKKLRSRERIYIVPTELGILTILGVVIIFFLGTEQEKFSLQALGLLISIFFLVGMIQSNHNLTKLKILFLSHEPTPEATLSSIPLRVTNNDSEPRFSIFFKVKLPRSSTYKMSFLDSHEEENLKLIYETPKRGIYPFPKIRIHSKFPLGLFYVMKEETKSFDWIVYPKPHGHPLPLTTQDDQNGDFVGFRDKNEHESDSRMDWKIYARLSRKMMKEFEEQDHPEFDFRWDHLATLKHEEKLSQLTLWVLEGYQRGISYSLTLPHFTLPSGAGLIHRDRALRGLAAYPL